MTSHPHQICLYHGIDLDGFCSGAIFAKAMEAKKEEYELVPANYGWDLPWEKFEGATVTLIDFSMQPWSEFVRLGQVAKEIIWLDHHKSTIEEFKRQEWMGSWCPIRPILDESRAGCEIAWNYYFPNTEMPTAVKLLGRYDVWDHGADERVLPFQYGMRLRDMRPKEGKDAHWWIDLLYPDPLDPPIVNQIVGEGRIVLKYQSQEDERAAKAICFELEWEGFKWICANRSGRGSKFFDSVWDPEKYDGMLSFGWNGKEFVVGLYCQTDDQREGRAELDCGAIAKGHGGGGHPGAAGFRTRRLPFVIYGTKIQQEG